jgi:hypothetical protein
MRRPTASARIVLCAIVVLAALLPWTPAIASTDSPKPVPAGFRAQSITWLTPDHGWVLGAAPCGTRTCAGVIETIDAGTTWHWVGNAGAPLATPGEPGIPGITDIRFTDEQHGWEFGPSLYATDDGGRTWHAAALPPHTDRLVAFAVDPVAAYAMISPCSIDRPLDHCHFPTTLWRMAAGSGSWTQLAVDLPVSFAGVIRLRQPDVYVVAQRFPPESDVFMVSTDGATTFSPRSSPCQPGRDEMLVDVAPVDASRVALLCVGDPGFSKSVKRVFRSNDTALTDASAGTAPLDGIESELAPITDLPGAPLLVASTSYGSFMYRNDGGQSWTEPLAIADGGQGWNDPTFTSATTAYVVHAPAARPDFAGELLVSHDAGATWEPMNLGG